MPPSRTPLTDALIDEAMTHAVKTVFHTMARMDASFNNRSSTVEVTTDASELQLVGNVGFGGDMNGLMYLCMPESFCMAVAAAVLSMDAFELAALGPEAVNDAIGEITNMTVGTFKNRLADFGYPCKLTLPTIVRGKGLSVRGIKGANRHICHFDVQGVRVSADLHLHVD